MRWSFGALYQRLLALCDEVGLGTAPGRGKSQTLWEVNRSLVWRLCSADASYMHIG